MPGTHDQSRDQVYRLQPHRCTGRSPHRDARRMATCGCIPLCPRKRRGTAATTDVMAGEQPVVKVRRRTRRTQARSARRHDAPEGRPCREAVPSEPIRTGCDWETGHRARWAFGSPQCAGSARNPFATAPGTCSVRYLAKARARRQVSYRRAVAHPQRRHRPRS
jgi:hypothetical protein